MNTVTKKAKQVAVAFVGGFVVLVGIVAIPYPGPGWLIVFAGLAILATEFDWARRLLARARGKYDQWVEWMNQQTDAIRFLFFLMTSLIVVVTIWLFNGYGLLNGWFNLDWDWLRSPVPIFYR